MEWSWADIGQMSVRPIVIPAFTLQHLGCWVIPARGTRLDRITFWRRFPVWGCDTFSRWTLLLPLGRRGDPHIPEIADALNRYGREHWPPFR